jgi:hypothetical protein
VSSAALSVLILLLLFGTQILSWYWLVLIPALSAAAGLYLVRRRLPGPYAAAQMVDARMGLADTLSTALYFSQAPPGPDESASGVRRRQGEQAERLAATVDARRAAPLSVPRTLYLVAVLALAATALFALRYGLSRKLDLKPPLAAMLQRQFGWNPRPDVARNGRRKSAPKPGDPEDNPAAAQDPEQHAAAQPDPAGDHDQGASDPGSADQKDTTADSRKQSDNAASVPGDEPEAQAEKSSGPQGTDSASASPPNSKADPSPSGGQRNSDNSGDNASWVNKLKDAFQNLLSRANPPKSGQDSGNHDQQPGKGQQSSAKPQSGKDAQASADQPGDAQNGQSGDEGKSRQDPNGKSGGENDGRQNSKQPGSGVGSQDGDKSLKQAQQLEAMGKLSEIYGKRAATITGEATVEVQSTSQQLRTQYVQRGAQHSQGGAEIDRDVIPVALQGYVERYFEQMRKPAPAPGKQ